MSKYEEYINEIERLFEENKAKEAEKYMFNALTEAETANDKAFALQMLNELIGYYRQTSEKEQLISVMKRSLEVADEMKLRQSEEGKIPYATTVLNVANGYRSLGLLEESQKYYEIVLSIYDECLEKGDMLFAGLYNNMSLLHQEKGDFACAESYLLKALDIEIMHDAGFETAVTYANLANTAVMKAQSEGTSDNNKYNKAKEYALEAVRRFKERNTYDAHFCAAISALGMCHYYDGNYSKAKELFGEGMKIVESTIGRNSQYERLKENYEMCQGKTMTGLELSKLYYEEYGKKMLQEKFPQYASEMAIGLVGEGSDCLSYDDEASRDHDWGPDFCLWLSDDLYEKIGEDLSKAYIELPKEFMGYTRTVSSRGAGRRGVLKISDFYKRFLCTDIYEDIDWRSVEDYNLLSATNGAVFEDEKGEFSLLRDKLKKGYPENILYLKIADDVAKICQSGQYNYQRVIKRGDRITADIMLNDCIKNIMILMHHMNNIYPPHDKWLYRSFKEIAAGEPIDALVEQLHSSLKLSDADSIGFVGNIMEQVGEYFANELYARNIISDVTTYLDYHVDELLKKSGYAAMTDNELVNLIARTEFAAFDKVQNEGGRASCQNNWPVFSVMRKSQYLTWNRTMLIQYLYDFVREFELGHNLITEKYGRMMESTAPAQYEQIKNNFPELSDGKKAVIEQIVAIQMEMLEAFGEEYPLSAGNARSFHTYEDNYVNTSYETYLRGEISTYSDKMLQLYGQFVVMCHSENKNIARMTIENTAKLYGYKDLYQLEKSLEQ